MIRGRPVRSSRRSLHRLTPLGGAVLCLACSDGPTSVDDPRRDTDLTVQASAEFGEPPLLGILRVVPPGEEVDTRFEIDLDEDGQPDAMGRVGWGAAVPYEFPGPGFHVISTTLEGARGRRTVRDTVVVNDPSAFRFESSHDLPGRPSTIVFDPERDLLYVVYSGTGDVRAHDPETMAVEWTLDIPKSWAVAALDLDLSTLYVGAGGLVGAGGVIGSGSIWAIDLDSPANPPRRAASPSGVTSGIAMAMAPGGDVLLNTVTQMTRYDPATGEIIADRTFDPGFFTTGFALSPDSLEVAVISPGRVWLLDTATLAIRHEVQLDGAAFVVAYSPDGGTVFVLSHARDAEWPHGQACRLYVLDAEALAVRARRSWVGQCDTFFPNDQRAALLPDRLGIVFTTENGALVIDVETERPLYRSSPDPTGVPAGCCGVAVDRGRNRLYFADTKLSRLVTMVLP